MATCADHNPRYFQPRTEDSRRRRGQSAIDNQQGRRIERQRDRGIEWPEAVSRRPDNCSLLPS